MTTSTGAPPVQIREVEKKDGHPTVPQSRCFTPPALPVPLSNAQNERFDADKIVRFLKGIT